MLYNPKNKEEGSKECEIYVMPGIESIMARAEDLLEHVTPDTSPTQIP